jgi:PhnB protein
MESAPISGVSIMLEGDDEALLTDLYGQLSVGGTITEQLARAPWGDTYGSFVDRFGVSWMVNIDGSGTQA